MGLLADGEFGIGALERDPALLRPEQAADQAQQRGFAGRVGAGHEHRLARPKREAQGPEDGPAAPDAGEIGGRESHQLCPGASGRDRAAKPPPAPAPPASPRARGRRAKSPVSVAMWLTSVDFLERRKKRPYKPIVPRSLSPRAELATDDEEALPVSPYRPAAALPVGWEPITMTSLDRFRCCKPLNGD